MKQRWQSFLRTIEPYRDVLQFVLVMLLSNVVWKLCIQGDEEAQSADALVTFLGQDVTALFNWMSCEVTREVVGWCRWFSEQVRMTGENGIFYSSQFSVLIVWGCAGLKQMFIFTSILLLARGRAIHKVWFIPLGLVFVHLVNVWRIGTIGFLCMNHPEWFEFLHGFFFKYLFYGLIFLYWIWWTEKVGKASVNS